ncbi:MAG: ROK family protein [Chloroflexi bacterium]|nr:ROK family protein [Chloroflexota bacterium]
MSLDRWAIGVDLAGANVQAAQVGADGQIRRRLVRPAEVKEGPSAIKAEIVAAVRELAAEVGSPPAGVGVGVPGQVDAETGAVGFAPRLAWRDVPLQSDLTQLLGLAVTVVNDIRAATWAEYVYGAGKDCDNLICLFVGTGIGGGVVNHGRLLEGCGNAAGEFGHMTIQVDGPLCRCGNHGCLEALAGGWAIAHQAQHAIEADPAAGATLLELSGGLVDAVTARVVVRAALAVDPLARTLMNRAAQALVAGSVTLVNAFNPCRLILGGSVIEAMPELIDQIDHGVRTRALDAASASLRVYLAHLRGDATAVGAADLALRGVQPGHPAGSAP